MSSEEGQENGIVSEDQVNTTEFYTVLNVGKDASEDDIRTAYKRLSLIYHPDRHPDPQNKEYAEHNFRRITQAFEVLSNPHKRALYDLYGEESLSMKMEVGSSLKTPAQMREEFEKEKKRREEARLRSQMFSKGEISVSFDASNIFDQEKRVGLSEILDLVPQMGNAVIKQSVEMSFMSDDRLTISGHNINLANSKTLSEISVGYQKSINNFSSLETKLSAGSRPSVSLKYNHNSLPFNCFGSTSVGISWNKSTPTFQRSALVGASIGEGAIGYINYSSGSEEEGMTVGVNKSYSNSSIKYSLQLSNAVTAASVNASYNLNNKSKLKTGITLGTTGFSIDMGADRKISDHTSASGQIQVSELGKTVFKISFTRLNQTFSIPLILSENFSFYALLAGSIFPLSVSLLLEKYLIGPYQERIKKEKHHKLREKNKESSQENRKNAKNTIKMIQEMVEKKKDHEISCNGLVILEARYGQLDVTGEFEENDEPYIDVTIALQSLVYNSKLFLPSKTKVHTIGFCDPCYGEPKKLFIKYLFRNKVHQVTLEDEEKVTLPLHSHAIQKE